MTTTPDGLVRDVFEVEPDDEQLTCAQIQNMVHDSLFCQYVTATYEGAKRSRSMCAS